MDRLNLGATELGLKLNAGQLEQFQLFYQELMDWNQRMNLTAITGYEEVQVKHFLDSLTVTLALEPPTGGEDYRVIDVGTGAGFPGVPLKILWPDVKLVLLDSTAKKASFLHHLKQKLGLDDVEIVVGRAEEVAHETQYREKFAVVLSRGVARLPTLLELTLPFCAVGGVLIAQRKGDTEAAISGAGKAISTLGGRLREAKKIVLEELTDGRYLLVVNKVSPTPEQYPRRPGIPAKRPLLL